MSAFAHPCPRVKRTTAPSTTQLSTFGERNLGQTVWHQLKTRVTVRDLGSELDSVAFNF